MKKMMMNQSLILSRLLFNLCIYLIFKYFIICNLNEKIEKIVNISDETQIKELLDKIKELENKPPQIVEKVKEVEIIKEIPVEVIKEVVVEKEVGNNLQPKLDALQNTVQKLKQDNIEKDKKIKEYEKTIQDIQKFNEDRRAMFLSGSNLEKPLIK